MTYNQQLLDPRWQKRKSEILIRDEWICKSCKSTDKTLHVHHIFYFSNLLAWEYPDDLLITLCVQCHEQEKERRRIEYNLLNALQVTGFLYSDILCLSVLLHDPEFSLFLLDKLRKIQNQ